ncbi:Cysteine protease atg4 [Emydomyces testavorans]|uniref:Cysteine protease n=1 Tax=Emydomyces testavorans TaxID=2070801 RepID=A0AAF0DKY4_9EURO|nr:Cysteine protease atg4 [Emydomyces testavorans]
MTTIDTMNNVDIGQKYKKIVHYFWDPEPKNNHNPDEPIWCLGKEYKTPILKCIGTESSESSGSRDMLSSSPVNKIPLVPQETPPPGTRISTQQTGRQNFAHEDWPSSFLDDFESRIWMTYRSNFPVIPKSNDPDALLSLTLSVRLRSQLLDTHGFTTDTGWGCMIRSGQSLLANALSILKLSRDWRRGTKIEEESALLSLFADDPQAPFSIHRFVEHGASACGKHPGEWFGPSATARCIDDGSDVYEDRFRQIAGSVNIRPTLILLGVRLGIENITPVYWEALKAIIKYPQSVGIAGGRPSSSHYFVGVQGPYFFYLDPHHTRPASSWKPDSTLSLEDLNTYHTRRLRRLHISEMDPSMLIGFLIKDDDDWQDWKQRVRSGTGKPIIHVFDGEPPNFGRHLEREEAVDEVETLEDDST